MFVGIVAIGGIVHELVHVVQSLGNSQTIYEVCFLGYRDGGAGWVDYSPARGNTFWLELPAYILQLSIIFILAVKCFKKD